MRRKKRKGLLKALFHKFDLFAPMPFSLFDAPFPENSARVGFSGNDLERLSEKRDAQTVAAAAADPRARTLIVGKGNLLIGQGENDSALIWRSFDEANALGAVPDHPVLLGYVKDGAPRFAMYAALDGDTRRTPMILSIIARSIFAAF